MPRKTVTQSELAPDDVCVEASAAQRSWKDVFRYRYGFSVNVRINSKRLPPVMDHSDSPETCNKIALNQYRVMQGEENQFVLNYIAISTIKASIPKSLSTTENRIIVIKSFGQTWLCCFQKKTKKVLKNDILNVLMDGVPPFFSSEI